MTPEQFEEVFNAQMAECQAVLVEKSKQYASDTDKLHNFKAAAGLKKIKPRQALDGMMLKHVVSIFDMTASDGDFPLEIWKEKITDNINYLILLRALVQEDEGPKELPPVEQLELMDRNARAYGWEIGHGKKIEPFITELSAENPFLQENWRDIATKENENGAE